VITVRAPRRERPVEDERPKLRVVDDAPATKPRRNLGGVIGTMLVGLLFACIFGVVVFQVFLVQTQSHLDDLSHKIDAQESRSKDLRLETATLESPARIQAAAQAQGMIAPKDAAWLEPKADDDVKDRYDPSKEKAATPSTTVPAPATGAAGTSSAARSTTGGSATTSHTGSTSASGTSSGAKTTATTGGTKTTPTTAKTTSTSGSGSGQSSGKTSGTSTGTGATSTGMGTSTNTGTGKSGTTATTVKPAR
jgi:cell division protein FtsL